VKLTNDLSTDVVTYSAYTVTGHGTSMTTTTIHASGEYSSNVGPIWKLTNTLTNTIRQAYLYSDTFVSEMPICTTLQICDLGVTYQAPITQPGNIQIVTGGYSNIVLLKLTSSGNWTTLTLPCTFSFSTTDTYRISSTSYPQRQIRFMEAGLYNANDILQSSDQCFTMNSTKGLTSTTSKSNNVQYSLTSAPIAKSSSYQLMQTTNPALLKINSVFQSTSPSRYIAQITTTTIPQRLATTNDDNRPTLGEDQYSLFTTYFIDDSTAVLDYNTEYIPNLTSTSTVLNNPPSLKISFLPSKNGIEDWATSGLAFVIYFILFLVITITLSKKLFSSGKSDNDTITILKSDRRARLQERRQEKQFLESHV